MADGPKLALESLLSEMVRARDAGRDYHLLAAFGVTVGDLREATWLGEWVEGMPRGLLPCPSWMSMVRTSHEIFTVGWAGGCSQPIKAPGFRGEEDSGTAECALYASTFAPRWLTTSFDDQADAAEKAARLWLGEAASGLMTPLTGALGWVAFLCRLAVISPCAVSYGLTSHVEADPPFRRWKNQERLKRWEGEGTEARSVYHWDTFDASIRGVPVFDPGFYALGLTRDVRDASIEVLRLVLTLGQEVTGRATNPPTGQADDGWVECSQNAVSEANGDGTSRPRYVEGLKDRGVILDYRTKPRKDGRSEVTAVQFSPSPESQALKARVQALLEGKPRRKRKRPER